ncbi:MAG: hypothetical protein SVM79_03090 [Chloroflexota bacterium]|nr:hypothetical protein [Chloroflexota bacterium]
MDKPAVPQSQRVFGEIVYWTTIISCIICIIGPLIAFINIDQNVVNPHYLFSNILDGMPPEAGVNMDEDAAAGATVLYLTKVDDFEAGQKVLIKDEHHEEFALIESVDEDADFITLAAGLANSYSKDAEGEVAEETIWQDAKDDIQGGHFWIGNFTTGDGFIQFGLVLGCAVGFIAMIGAALMFIFKEKSYGWALGSIWIAVMIGVSVVGIISLH